MSFGEKVQLLRRNNNMSQESLANALRINRNNLSRIETGKSEPGLAIIKGIATIFNVDVASLIGMDSNDMASEDKIRMIENGCHGLLDSDLDLIIRMISILKEEYVKSNIRNN